MSVAENLQHVNQVIAKACEKVGRKKEEVTILAVTKYVDVAKTKEVIEAGIEHIGENRVDGALEKWEALQGQANFHFVGTLQSRKVKQVIDKYDYFHSLDRISLAKEFQKRCPEGKKIKAYVQVNVSGEESKFGLAPEETVPFIESLQDYPAIEVIGLMTMAPFEEDPEKTRPVFRGLRELRDEVQSHQFPHAPCQGLSMGMSNDYHIAVEEGATIVRLGSILTKE